VVIPLKRRVTRQIARKGASHRVSSHWPDCIVARFANARWPFDAARAVHSNQ
jgi:hypothetical protein